MRDWAGAASRAADYPPIVASCFYREDGAATPPLALGDATRAMRDALSTYLSALVTIAADGVLDYREDPFAQLSGRAAAASEAGGAAVATLGGVLHRATHRQSRAPQLGETISEADASAQALIEALRGAVRGGGPSLAAERSAVAAA